MGRSTFISAALHVAILTWVLVAFPSGSGSPLVAIPIDLATPADITKIKAGMKDAQDEAPLAGQPKEQKQAAVKEKTAETSPERTPVPPEKPKDPPKKQAKPEAADNKLAAQAKAIPPVPKPKPAAPVRKKQSETDRIAALLNKLPNEVEEPKPQETQAENKPVRGQTDGAQITMSVNEIDVLRARIAQCWNPPPGGLGAEEILVRIRLKLNEDGTLVGYPSVTNHGGSPFFQAAADSAVRAVIQCQPYALPSEKYALWRDMILNFDPSDMYRSG
jgi:outer membrane biosynthesis protein TonB